MVLVSILPLGKTGECLVWQREFSRIKEELHTYVVKNEKIFTPFLEKEKPKTLWTDKLFSNPEYGTELLKEILNMEVAENTPKSIYTVMKFLEMVEKDSIIVDFFGGSGTTAHAVLELNKEGSNRKFVLVEMGEHFYEKIIPRIKKVAFSSEWKGGKLKDNKQVKPISIAFRYYELESYEEALKECEYVLMDSEYTKPFSCHTKAPSTCHTEALAEVSKNIESKRDISASPQYDKEAQCTAICKDSQSIYPAKDYQKAQKIIDYRKSRKLIKKLNKGETITLDMSGYRKEFDLFHTLANLQGLKIKRLFLDSKGIETCEFDNGDIVSLDQIDLHTYPKLKNLLWW